MNEKSEQAPQSQDEVVIPVIEEELVAGRRQVKTGSVRVDKHVEKRIRRVEAPLLQENVEIRRVPVNRVIDEEPPIRHHGNAVVVPIVEEELVITKRLVLKEEIYLTKRRIKDRVVKDVQLNLERAEIRRFGAEGRPRDRAVPRQPFQHSAGRRSILG